MKILFILMFFLLAQADKEPLPEDKQGLEVKERKENTDQSLKKKSDRQNQKPPKGEAKPPGAITRKIKEVFKDFLDILEKEKVQSKEYIKAVKFLENSLYNEAAFESLKLLADVYHEKKDFQNQINVLNILSVNYSNNFKSFYLLGMAYKDLYLSEEENKAEDKQRAIENFNKALKINRKYVPAYKALLELLVDEDPETGEEVHTKESLSVAMDMLKNLRKDKYYIPLCKAYYDNRFFKQSRRACIKSVRKNPKDPVSSVILALSLADKKKINKALLKVAGKFRKSFFVQYKIALYFMDKDPKLAVAYFDSAYTLESENVQLNRIMAKFFFDNKEEERSYIHFLNACRLTQGKFLKDFRKAKSALRRKQLVDLVLKFQKGIDQCFVEIKKEQKSKKRADSV